MRVVIVATLAGSVLLGCSGESGALADDLKADLEATKSTIELAAQSSGTQPLRFVSELEQGQNAEPIERTRAPRRVAAQQTGTQPEAESSPAPEPQAQTLVSTPETVAQQAPQPTPEVSSVPSVAPRPASLPVEIPADGGGRGLGSGGIGTGDNGAGIGIGEVIGVVIRGGGVGPDHCPPRRRPRGRILR